MLQFASLALLIVYFGIKNEISETGFMPQFFILKLYLTEELLPDGVVEGNLKVREVMG